MKYEMQNQKSPFSMYLQYSIPHCVPMNTKCAVQWESYLLYLKVFIYTWKVFALKTFKPKYPFILDNLQKLPFLKTSNTIS